MEPKVGDVFKWYGQSGYALVKVTAVNKAGRGHRLTLKTVGNNISPDLRELYKNRPEHFTAYRPGYEVSVTLSAFRRNTYLEPVKTEVN